MYMYHRKMAGNFIHKLENPGNPSLEPVSNHSKFLQSSGPEILEQEPAPQVGEMRGPSS